MCHIAELVIGGCVLIAMTTLGVVAILGVLGVLERTFGVTATWSNKCGRQWGRFDLITKFTKNSR